MKVFLSTSAPRKLPSKAFKVTLPKVRKANKEYSVEFGTLAKLANDGVDLDEVLYKRRESVRFLVNIGNFIFGRGAEYNNGTELAREIIDTAIEKGIADPKLFNAQDYARLTGTKLKPTVLKKFSAVECKKIQDKLAKDLKKGYDLSYDLRGYNSSVTVPDANMHETKTRYIRISPKTVSMPGNQSEYPANMNRLFYKQSTGVEIYLMSDHVRVDYTLFQGRGNSSTIKSVKYKVDDATYKNINKFVNFLVGKIRMVKSKRPLEVSKMDVMEVLKAARLKPSKHRLSVEKGGKIAVNYFHSGREKMSIEQYIDRVKKAFADSDKLKLTGLNVHTTSYIYYTISLK